MNREEYYEDDEIVDGFNLEAGDYVNNELIVEVYQNDDGWTIELEDGQKIGFTYMNIDDDSVTMVVNFH